MNMLNLVMELLMTHGQQVQEIDLGSQIKCNFQPEDLFHHAT